MKMLRITGSGPVAALALLAYGAPALALAQAAGGTQPSRVMVTTRADSTRKDVFVLRQVTPLIDSLIRRRNYLAIGSSEYIAVDDSLWRAISALPLPPAFAAARNGTFHIEIAPTPRAALRLSTVDNVPEGWFGFQADGVARNWHSPNGVYVQHLSYPAVVSIEPNSPASRAGVRSGDSVLAYNGLDLRRQLINLTQLLTPGHEVAVRLLRDGETKEVMVTVEKAPASLMTERRNEATVRAMAEAEERRIIELRAASQREQVVRGTPLPSVVAPRSPVAVAARAGGSYSMTPSTTGVLGAATVTVDREMGSSFRGMEGKAGGVLVTMVSPGSPADQTGLRKGDVVLRVENFDVTSTSTLRVRLYEAEQKGVERIRLTVLRAGKTQELIFEPKRQP